MRDLCRVELPNGMRVTDCPALVSNGKAWATLASRPVINQDRWQKVDRAGECRNRDLASRFSVTLITLLGDAHAGAID